MGLAERMEIGNCCTVEARKLERAGTPLKTKEEGTAAQIILHPFSNFLAFPTLPITREMLSGSDDPSGCVVSYGLQPSAHRVVAVRGSGSPEPLVDGNVCLMSQPQPGASRGAQICSLMV